MYMTFGLKFGTPGANNQTGNIRLEISEDTPYIIKISVFEIQVAWLVQRLNGVVDLVSPMGEPEFLIPIGYTDPMTGIFTSPFSLEQILYLASNAGALNQR